MAGFKLHEFVFNLRPRDNIFAHPLLVSLDCNNGETTLTLRTEKLSEGLKIIVQAPAYDEVNDFLNMLSDEMMDKKITGQKPKR